MAIQLGSAYGKVQIDSSGVTSGVNSAIGSLNKLSSIATSVGGAMQNVGNAMTIGLTLPILAMGGASIKAASDLSESMNKVQVVFGNASDSILAWSEDSATAFGQSKQQALEAAGTFGNLFTTMGVTGTEAANMSMNLVQLASDLASFNNISPDEALLKLRAGLVGETEPLRTLGVNLTANAVKAKAMQMGLADANGELSQAALLQARYALILEQTSTAQGDFARTSEGMANQSRIAKAEFQNLLAELGDNILPVALKVVQGLNKILDFFNRLPEPVQNGIIVLAGFLAVLGPIISFLGTIISFIGGIASLATTLGGLGISFASISAAAGAAMTALGGFAAAAGTVVLPILLIIGAIALLYFAFKNNFMGITTTAQQLWFLLKFYFMQGWQILLQVSQQRALQLQTWFKNLVTRITQIFKSLNWAQIGKWVMMGITNGLLMGIPAMVAAAVKGAKAVMQAFDRVFDSHSPSEEMKKRGVWAGQGFIGGWEKILQPKTVAQQMAKPILNTSNTNQSQYNMNFGNGLTLRDVDRLMEQKLNGFTRQLNNALGGA